MWHELNGSIFDYPVAEEMDITYEEQCGDVYIVAWETDETYLVADAEGNVDIAILRIVLEYVDKDTRKTPKKIDKYFTHPGEAEMLKGITLWMPASELEMKLKKRTDNVEHPKHYHREGAMECIQELRTILTPEQYKGFILGNIWKHRYRAADKNGAEELRESDWYMRLLEAEFPQGF